MALNWVMLGQKGELVPLQDEKIFLQVASTAASLQAMKNSSEASSAKPLKAHGTSYITNKRLVFVSATASSQPRPSTLATLSCPLSHLQDGRFVQPWLSANYWECLVRPVADGGLTAPLTLRLDFKEGRGFEFTTAVEEVKSRFDEDRGNSRRAEAEALPVYEAGSASPISTRHSALPSPSSSSQANIPPSQPSEGDLQAAAVARGAESQEIERDEEHRGLPPSYSA